MTQTYYEVLGVNEDADDEDIRQAYREKLHEYHPDASDDPNAQEHYLLVKEANAVLSDPEERRRYDELGHEEYVARSDGKRTKDIEPDDESGSETDESASASDTSGRSGGQGGGRGRGGRGSRDGRSRDEDGDHRNGSGRTGRSAADKYRNRRRRTQARSRSDRGGGSGGSRGGRSRSEGRSRSGAGSTENATESGASESASSSEPRTDWGSASEEDDPAETEEDTSSSRGVGQPAASGMFVSPDIELLRFPGLATYYFLGMEFGLSLALAPLFVPIYLYYRRHKFTERLLTDEIIPGEDASKFVKRVAGGGVFATLFTLSLTAVYFGDFLSFSYTHPAVLALGAGTAVGLAVSLYSFAQLLLFDWFEQRVTQPVAWDVLSRTPVLLVPLVLVQQAAFPRPTLVVIGLLAISAISPLIYVILNGQELGVDVSDARL